jgi:16S rRNA (cytosine1402-N4)-methyltransferase
VHEPVHIPVLLDECLNLLDPGPGQVFVDCTAGLGGHAARFAPRLGPTGTLVLCDLDPGNLARAGERVSGLAGGPKVLTHHGSFAEAPRRLLEWGLQADGVLADLGFASPHVDDGSRGLSFSRDGPLDMRLDPTRGATAADLVRSLSEAELADIIYRFGEDRMARPIARRIVEARRQAPIERTGQLADVIRSVVRRVPGQIDPATRTFQALRIAVNDELGHLEGLLDWISRGARAAARAGRVSGGKTLGVPGGGGPGRGKTGEAWLRPGARVGVIAFHSLEDRPVKQAFAELVEQGLAEAVTGKPVVAGAAELAANPRSSSAKLRVVRLGAVAGITPGTGDAP